LFLLVRGLFGTQVAAITVALWAAHPASIVLSSVYSEALFCAFAFSALLAAHRQRWLLAGLLGFFAGLVRAQGLALGGALVLYALWFWWRSTRLPTPEPPDEPPDEAAVPGEGMASGRLSVADGLRAVGGSALALLGTPFYIVIIGLQLGDLRTWFTQQQLGWQTEWNWGATAPAQLWHEIGNADHFFPVICGLLVVVAIVLLVSAMEQRVWAGLVLFGALVIVQAVGSSVVMQSKPRLLLPAAVVFIPIALGLNRTRPITRWLGVSCLVLFGLWLGDYSVTVWMYGI